MSAIWLYGLAIVAIVAFCFWKPDFPRRLAPIVGIHGEFGTKIFLVVYWIAIPIVIHRLMSQIPIPLG